MFGHGSKNKREESKHEESKREESYESFESYESYDSLTDLLTFYNEISRDSPKKSRGVCFERFSSSENQRITASKESKDSKDLKLAILCVARRNAYGHRNVLKDKSGTTICDIELQPNDLLLFDHESIDNYNTLVFSVNKKYEGHVDTITLF